MREHRTQPFRRFFLAVLAGLLLVPVSTWGDAWKPARPVAFIVGASPGGSLDLTARALQQIWDSRKTIGVPVVVVNKPGAGNAIAWTYMNDRGGDGHTIAIGTTNLITNPVSGAHPLGYKGVTPLAILLDDYAAFIVRADSPLKSMKDIVERLKKDPAAVSIAIAPGRGAGPHTAAAVAFKAAGIPVREMRFVVYKAASESLTALIGGEIDMAALSASNVPPYLQAGRVRVLAVTSAKRLGGVLTSAPTLKEAGIDATFTNWRAVIGPKGMRRDAVAFWEKALAEATQTDAWRKELERNFWAPDFLTGERARAFLDDEDRRFSGIWRDIKD